ncbi:hypothetical protein RIF29_09403 [Crotalaria pallida]|uniref:Uncharacterized protein n=1 Tax=Crotalaria pallida TaxID=3830 RepID=A0AAN9FRT9_CROPI
MKDFRVYLSAKLVTLNGELLGIDLLSGLELNKHCLEKLQQLPQNPRTPYRTLFEKMELVSGKRKGKEVESSSETVAKRVTVSFLLTITIKDNYEEISSLFIESNVPLEVIDIDKLLDIYDFHPDRATSPPSPHLMLIYSFLYLSHSLIELYAHFEQLIDIYDFQRYATSNEK